MMWSIIQLPFTLKTKLNCHILSDKVRSMMKSRQDNNMTYRIGVVYAEIKIELY